ncbi:MAG TPA: hypothetical protein VH601_02105 [Bryobacteraceae bacterium]|jgi:hypothetical protein
MRARASGKPVSLFISLSFFGTLSCTAPTSIATFAESVNGVIAQGPPIFADIHDSCVRRQDEEARVNPEYPHREQGRIQKPVKAPDSSVCAAFVSEVKELEDVSSLLSSYFRAVQELAAFDESTVSGEAQKAGEGVSAAAILSANQADSVAKLSGLITRAFTEHYRRGKLRELLIAADPHIAVISQALEGIASKDYGGLLDEEERAMNRRYQETGVTTDAAIVLLLNRAYREDLDELRQRRAAATAYSSALRQAREGHHQLASTITRLNNKEIALTLEPYIAELQALAPSVHNQP